MFKGAICRLVNVRCFAVRCFCCKIFELHRIQMLYFRHPSFDSVLFYRRRRMHKACIISALWVERRKDWTLRRWASRRRNCRQPSLALEVTHERGHARCCFVGSAHLSVQEVMADSSRLQVTIEPRLSEGIFCVQFFIIQTDLTTCWRWRIRSALQKLIFREHAVAFW